MFRRAHHQRIAKALDALNHDLLLETECYFGGGTAIALELDEYRQSQDIDFLCASQAGYRELRTRIYNNRLDALLRKPLTALRDVRADQYGIRTFVEVDDTPIKFEIIREARIGLSGAINPRLSVPQLCRTDLYAEKLLANTDRGSDRSVMSRDIIDLSMMVLHWGSIPDEAWLKAEGAYGAAVRTAYQRSAEAITDRKWLRECMEAMSMAVEHEDRIVALNQSAIESR